MKSCRALDFLISQGVLENVVMFPPKSPWEKSNFPWEKYLLGGGWTFQIDRGGVGRGGARPCAGESLGGTVVPALPQMTKVKVTVASPKAQELQLNERRSLITMLKTGLTVLLFLTVGINRGAVSDVIFRRCAEVSIVEVMSAHCRSPYGCCHTPEES